MRCRIDPKVEAAWELARSRPLSDAIDTLAQLFRMPRQEASRLIWRELLEPEPRSDQED